MRRVVFWRVLFVLRKGSFVLNGSILACFGVFCSCCWRLCSVCVPFVLAACSVLRTGAGEKKKRRTGADYFPFYRSENFHELVFLFDIGWIDVV